MRQVPRGSRYLIVGNGRVARHMAHYFSLLNIEFIQWHRGQTIGQKSIGPLALNIAVQSCHQALILITDSAIEEFILANPCLESIPLIHFSGSLTTKLAMGAHPLMTFADELYPEETYREFSFIIEKSQHDNCELLSELPNKRYPIEPELKPLYHSLCVLSGNFSTLLWQKFFLEMNGKFKIPQEATIPYMERIFKNLMAHPFSALTGPLARGDQKTIESNLTALAGDPFQNIYQEFVGAYNSTKQSSPSIKGFNQ